MSDTKTLIGLLFDLSDTIEGADGDNGFLISKAADTLEQLERENAALRKALYESDVVAEYSRADGQREWWSGGYWLHRDEVLVCMDRAAIDAARKEAQP